MDRYHDNGTRINPNLKQFSFTYVIVKAISFCDITSIIFILKVEEKNEMDNYFSSFEVILKTTF